MTYTLEVGFLKYKDLVGGENYSSFSQKYYLLLTEEKKRMPENSEILGIQNLFYFTKILILRKSTCSKYSSFKEHIGEYFILVIFFSWLFNLQFSITLLMRSSIISLNIYMTESKNCFRYYFLVSAQFLELFKYLTVYCFLSPSATVWKHGREMLLFYSDKKAGLWLILSLKRLK